MNPIFVRISIIIIFGVSVLGAFEIGYLMAESKQKSRQNEVIGIMSQRISELEEREKSRVTSDDKAGKPPKSR